MEIFERVYKRYQKQRNEKYRYQSMVICFLIMFIVTLLLLLFLNIFELPVILPILLFSLLMLCLFKKTVFFILKSCISIPVSIKNDAQLEHYFVEKDKALLYDLLKEEDLFTERDMTYYMEYIKTKKKSQPKLYFSIPLTLFLTWLSSSFLNYPEKKESMFLTYQAFLLLILFIMLFQYFLFAVWSVIQVFTGTYFLKEDFLNIMYDLCYHVSSYERKKKIQKFLNI